MNKTDETEALFLRKCLILPLTFLTFLRLTNFKPLHGNTYNISLSLYAAILRLQL